MDSATATDELREGARGEEVCELSAGEMGEAPLAVPMISAQPWKLGSGVAAAVIANRLGKVVMGSEIWQIHT